MRCPRWVGTALIALGAATSGSGDDHRCCEPPESCWLRRWHPVGGWHPYGTGMLRWWPRHCFPCGGAPDDYCRKQLPQACWPPYPPYYIWEPPAVGCPPCNDGPSEEAVPHPAAPGL